MREEEIARKLADRIAMEGKPRQAPGVHVEASQGGFAINGNGNVVYAGGPSGGPPGDTPDRTGATRLRVCMMIGLLAHLAVHAGFVYWHYNPQGGPLIGQMLFDGWPITWQYIFGNMLVFGAVTALAYIWVPSRWFRH